MNEEQKRILLKVSELYTKYGIKSITMDDVARELGISKKTLYQFVSDKNELVGKFIDLEIEIKQKEICNCFKQNLNAIEGLFEISQLMNRTMKEQNPSVEYDLKKYYPQHYQKILKARREGMYKYILLNLEQGIAEGFYRKELNVDIIAKLHLFRLENTFLSDIFSSDEANSPEIFNEIFIYHIRGISNEKGIKFLEQKIKEVENNNI